MQPNKFQPFFNSSPLNFPLIFSSTPQFLHQIISNPLRHFLIFIYIPNSTFLLHTLFFFQPQHFFIFTPKNLPYFSQNHPLFYFLFFLISSTFSNLFLHLILFISLFSTILTTYLLSKHSYSLYFYFHFFTFFSPSASHFATFPIIFLPKSPPNCTKLYQSTLNHF